MTWYPCDVCGEERCGKSGQHCFVCKAVDRATSCICDNYLEITFADHDDAQLEKELIRRKKIRKLGKIEQLEQEIAERKNAIKKLKDEQ